MSVLNEQKTTCLRPGQLIPPFIFGLFRKLKQTHPTCQATPRWLQQGTQERAYTSVQPDSSGIPMLNKPRTIDALLRCRDRAGDYVKGVNWMTSDLAAMMLSSHSNPLKLHYMFHIKLVNRVTYRELKIRLKTKCTDRFCNGAPEQLTRQPVWSYYHRQQREWCLYTSINSTEEGKSTRNWLVAGKSKTALNIIKS